MISDGEKRANNGGLVVVLIILVAIIIGLLIGVLVLYINRGENEPTNEETKTASTMTTDEDRAAFEDYINRFNEVSAKANALYNRESVLASEILDVYGPTIDYYLSRNDYSNAQTFILLRTDDLMKYNYKKEAMDTLTSIDYSFFPKAIQNRYYHRIVSIANGLGEDEVASKYQKLANDTEAAVEEAKRQSREWQEVFNAPIKEEDDKR